MTATLPITNVRTLDDRFDGLEGLDLIAATYSEFGDRFAVVSSFGTESAVLLHLTAQVSRDIPVIFLNTGKLFGETLRYQKTLIEQLGLNRVVSVEPDPGDVSAKDPKGVLWTRDLDSCCFIRKVRPLAKALEGYEAWATGRKTFQGGARSALRLIESDGPRVKINPLANWSRDEIESYFAQHNLPQHPLKAEGYLSVGCMPCTTPTGQDESSRSGRWRGQDKSECGIHIPSLVEGAGATP